MGLMMSDPSGLNRTRRIGLNQALFRTLNERVETIAESLKATPEALRLVCECGNLACDARFEMSRDDYEAIRSDPSLFAVAPGHASESVESVLERRGTFEVVRKKQGEPAELAARTDPRSG